MIKLEYFKMKIDKLTIAPRAGKRSFEYLEQMSGFNLSENFVKFMTKYAGLAVVERFYNDSNKHKWELQSFDDIISSAKLSKEFKENGWGLKLPFAFDPGGWHYCISYEEKTFNKILVNRWTDHLPEDQFIVIANSFEDFINGLYIEE